MRKVWVLAGLSWGIGCSDPVSGEDGGGSTTTAPASTSDTMTGVGPTSSLDTTAAVDGTTTEGASDSSGDGLGVDYGEPGPWSVGVQTTTVAGRGRDVLVTLWYPTDVAGGSAPLSDLVATDDAATLDMLLADAPADCVRAQTQATLDAPVAAGPFPVVMFSHCLACLGASSSFVAERMASHGMVVAGVTHTDDTLFDKLAGTMAPLSAQWLAVRTLDIRAAFDAVTTGGPVASAIDARRAGVFGHSYGATTTGKVLQDDDRFVAGVALAAPVQNPLLPGVDTAAIAQPMLYMLMAEDNSIQQIGNTLIRNNAMAMPGGAWLVELADAGHWSVSDLCGIVDDFAPGCGMGTRQTDGTPFTYLDATTARDLTAGYVTAFFALHLHAEPSAEDFLGAADPPDVVTITRFE